MAPPKVSSRRRITAIVIFLTAVMALTLIFRVGYWQIYKADWLKEKAADQWTRELPVSPKRGDIIDKNGTVLAKSASSNMVFVLPKQIQQAEKNQAGTLQSVAETLAAELSMNLDTVLAKIKDTTKSEILLKRQISREQADRLTALKDEDKLVGVRLSEDMKRYYPMGNFLTQVLGFTSIDGEGLEGVEARFNKYLSGTAGSIVSETDAKGLPIPDSVDQYVPPVDGDNVKLTIDMVIQSFCENAMSKCLAEQKAKRVICIVMDPDTGAILAMVTKPDFDNNNPPRNDMTFLQSAMRNTAVADAFEPGSTFKVLTLAAGLDSGAINESTSFYCPGYHLVEGQKIRCWSARPHGSQDIYEGAQHSCNPVFMQTALKMGKDTFYRYLSNFGLGRQLGIDLNGEGTGIVTSPKYVRDIDLARIGFGQSIAVTPLQLITASAACVNGGSLMKPYVVSAVQDADGNVITKYEPEKLTQAIKPETSALVRDILWSVVEKGSGKNAKIDGYTVGGKTGTAQKYGEDGRILQNKHVASFMAFAPVEHPKYIVLVVVDEPDVAVDFGSIVAAPYAKMILEDTLKYGGVRPTAEAEAEPEETRDVPDLTGMELDQAASELTDTGFKYVVEGFGGTVADQMPKPAFTAAKGSTVIIYLTQEDDACAEYEHAMPELINKTAVEVNTILDSMGLKMKATGTGGLVARQKPDPGATVYSGETVEVDFQPAPEETDQGGDDNNDN